MVFYRWMIILLTVSLASGVAITAAAAATQDVPRMTKEELKAMLESPDLVIIDARRGKDWDASEFKIRGAERKDPGKFDAWVDQVPKDKTLVIYCA